MQAWPPSMKTSKIYLTCAAILTENKLETGRRTLYNKSCMEDTYIIESEGKKNNPVGTSVLR